MQSDHISGVAKVLSGNHIFTKINRCLDTDLLYRQ